MANILLTGWITEYNAQGMESEFWRVFQDQTHTQSRDSGWDLAGMHRLATGQQLTIFAANGQGMLQPRWFGQWLRLRRCYPSDSDWSPLGVALSDWERWFRHSPPLAATLLLPVDAAD
jgi:hypothetical protein